MKKIENESLNKIVTKISNVEEKSINYIKCTPKVDPEIIEENKIPLKRPRKSKSNIVLAFLLLLIFGTIVFTIYYLYFKPNTTNINTIETNNLVSKSEMNQFISSGINKLLMTQSNISDVQTFLKNQTDEVKVKFAIDLLEKQNKKLSLANVNKIINQYFNSNINTPVNYTCPVDNLNIYIYDSTSQMWIKNSEHPDHEPAYPTFDIASTYIIKSDNSVLVTKQLISKLENNIDMPKYYSNYTEATNGGNYLFSNTEENQVKLTFKQLCKTAPTTLTTYSYTFTKTNGKIILTKYAVS